MEPWNDYNLYMHSIHSTTTGNIIETVNSLYEYMSTHGNPSKLGLHTATSREHKVVRPGHSSPIS